MGTRLKVSTAAKFDWFMFFCRWTAILRPCEPSSNMERTYNIITCVLMSYSGPSTSFKQGKKAGRGLRMRRLYDHVLFFSTDWENPAPEIPVHDWKCEFTDAGRGEEEERGEGGERRETVFLSLDLIQHLLLVFGAGSTLYTEKIGLGSGIKTSLKACIASGVPDSQAIKNSLGMRLVTMSLMRVFFCNFIGQSMVLNLMCHVICA